MAFSNLIYKIESVVIFVSVFSLMAHERINQFAPNLLRLCLETNKRLYEGQNFKKLSRVQVPASVVSVARKLNTIERRHQDRISFFSKRRLQKQILQPRRNILCSRADKYVGFRVFFLRYIKIRI